MTEFAQERLERLIPIFEQLQRVQLFSSDEVKKLIKKCRLFEHKLEKRVKDKNDFLRYAQYLVHFLALIRERRESIKYMYKKKEIDFAVEKKIELLFRAACYRFQADIKLWLSWIHFTKTRRLFVGTGRIFMRLLQVHTDKPYLWISAAKWEFEGNRSIENARGLLQRGLRFNPDCVKLYLELFRLELLFIDTVRKRKDALGGDGELVGEMEEEAADAVLSGKLAQLIFHSAMEKFPGDVELCTNFGKIASEYSFASDLVEYIYQYIDSTFGNCEESVLAQVTRKYLQNPGNLTCCKTIFEEAVNRFNSEKIWNYYIRFYMDRLEDPCSSRNNISGQCLEILERASECTEMIFDEELYKKWISLSDDPYLRQNITKIAVGMYPKSSGLWETLIECHMLNGATEKEIMNCFNKAVAIVPEKDSLSLWQLAINWANQICPERVEQLFKASFILIPAVSGPMKVAYLEWILETGGVDTLREKFRQLCLEKPNSLDFYLAYYNIEKAQMKPDVNSIRHCFEQALVDHGGQSLEIWLSWVEFELRGPNGDPGRMSGLYGRAIKNLQEDKVEMFMREYMLLTK